MRLACRRACLIVAGSGRGEPCGPRPRRTPVHLVPRTGLAVVAVGAAFVAGLSMRSPASAGQDPGPRRRQPDPAGERRPPPGDVLRRTAEVVRRPGRGARDAVGLGRGADLHARGRRGRSAQGAVAGAAPVPSGAPASGTGTNVQEAGVDEPDVVKTDGRLLVRVNEGSDPRGVRRDGHRAGPGSGRWHSPGSSPPSCCWSATASWWSGARPGVAEGRSRPGHRGDGRRHLRPDGARPVRTSTYDSSLRHRAPARRRRAARCSRPACRSWTSSNRGCCAARAPRGRRTRRRARQHHRRLAAARDHRGRGRPDDHLDEQVADCDDVAIPAADAGLGTVAVVGFDVTTRETTEVDGGDDAERDGVRLGRPPVPGQLGLPARAGRPAAGTSPNPGRRRKSR